MLKEQVAKLLCPGAVLASESVTRIKTFGSLSVWRPDGTEILSVLRHRKWVALFAYLVVARPEGFHSRDSLLALFWPDDDWHHSRGSLRQALYRLRQELGNNMILTKGPTAVGINRPGCLCDVAQFDAAIAADNAAQAVACYTGPFLDDVHITGAAEFERWVEAERSRLANAYADALERLAVRSGDPREAVKWWRRLADQEPYGGRVAIEFMKVLASVGSRASAIQVAERHARLLQNDLAAAPDPHVARLADDLRRGLTPALAVTRH